MLLLKLNMKTTAVQLLGRKSNQIKSQNLHEYVSDEFYIRKSLTYRYKFMSS